MFRGLDSKKGLDGANGEEDSRHANPFRLTKQEKAMLDPNYKKARKKVSTTDCELIYYII